MSPVASVPNPVRSVASRTTSELQVHARFLSLNGGVVFALCLVFTAFVIATLLAERTAIVHLIAFGVLAAVAWGYWLNGVTEQLSFADGVLEHSSLFGQRARVMLNDPQALLVVHEGLNEERGIESITVRERGGKTVRLSLGPAWRRRELEAFFINVERAVGNRKLVERVR